MKQFFLVGVLIFYVVLSPVFAQNKTYFGVEGAITHDLYEIQDDGNTLKTVPLIEGLWGVNIRQDLNRLFFVEAALARNYYDEGFGFKTVPYYGSSSGIDAWLIPLRAGAKVNLYHQKVYAVPLIGYAFCINSDYPFPGQGHGTARSSTITVLYSYSETYPTSTRYFSLLQAGVGLEFKLFKALLFSMSSSYYKGFAKVVQLDIVYSVNNSSSIRATSVSKGDFWTLGAGFKYPVSDLWTRR
jgi:hypothetical protein